MSPHLPNSRQDKGNKKANTTRCREHSQVTQPTGGIGQTVAHVGFMPPVLQYPSSQQPTSYPSLHRGEASSYRQPLLRERAHRHYTNLEQPCDDLSDTFYNNIIIDSEIRRQYTSTTDVEGRYIYGPRQLPTAPYIPESVLQPTWNASGVPLSIPPPYSDEEMFGPDNGTTHIPSTAQRTCTTPQPEVEARASNEDAPAESAKESPCSGIEEVARTYLEPEGVTG